MQPQQEIEDTEETVDNELAVARKKKVSCFERIFSIVFKKKPPIDLNKQNEKLLELLKPIRYKPDTVEQMALETKFTKEEVKSLYRAFKQECPTGISDEETFKDVYQKIFPLGESSKYAHLVFNSIDMEQTGGITFGDFMDFLSVLTKGSQQEKILWSFQFYDVNNDGIISRDEMIKVGDGIISIGTSWLRLVIVLSVGPCTMRLAGCFINTFSYLLPMVFKPQIVLVILVTD